MSETAQECGHECSSCQTECASRTQPQSMIIPMNEKSRVGKVIGVVSGKGGVGKSMISSMLAVNLQRAGHKTAIMDADVTGPSIPKVFGLHEQAVGDNDYIFPVETKTGIKVMSVNLLLEDETDPVIWRGPVISNTLRQFWSGVLWGDVDCMVVDMPPGTGDVPLTVFQALPVNGIVIVTSPQELVSVIVAKAVKMAKMMGVPILGIVENMSYVSCPCCGEKIKVYGESHVQQVADEYGIPVLGQIPMDPQIAAASDQGNIEELSGEWIADAVDMIEAIR